MGTQPTLEVAQKNITDLSATLHQHLKTLENANKPNASESWTNPGWSLFGGWSEAKTHAQFSDYKTVLKFLETQLSAAIATKPVSIAQLAQVIHRLANETIRFGENAPKTLAEILKSWTELYRPAPIDDDHFLDTLITDLTTLSDAHAAAENAKPDSQTTVAVTSLLEKFGIASEFDAEVIDFDKEEEEDEHGELAESVIEKKSLEAALSEIVPQPNHGEMLAILKQFHVFLKHDDEEKHHDLLNQSKTLFEQHLKEYRQGRDAAPVAAPEISVEAPSDDEDDLARQDVLIVELTLQLEQKLLALEIAANSLEEQENLLKERAATISELSSENRSLKTENSELRPEVYVTLPSVLDELQQKDKEINVTTKDHIKRVEKVDRDLHAKVAENNKLRAKLKDVHNELKSTRTSHDREIAALTEQTLKLEQTIASLKQTTDAQKAQIGRLKAEKNRARSSEHTASAEYNRQETTIAHLREKVAKQQKEISDLELLKPQVTFLSSRNEHLAGENITLEKKLTNLAAQVDHEATSRKQLETENNALKVQLRILELENQQSPKVDQNTTQLAEKRERVKALREFTQQFALLLAPLRKGSQTPARKKFWEVAKGLFSKAGDRVKNMFSASADINIETLDHREARAILKSTPKKFTALYNNLPSEIKAQADAQGLTPQKLTEITTRNTATM